MTTTETPKIHLRVYEECATGEGITIYLSCSRGNSDSVVDDEFKRNFGLMYFRISERFEFSSVEDFYKSQYSNVVPKII